MNHLELLQIRGMLPTREEVRRETPWSFRLYQNANATQPVTRHGQPIGAMVKNSEKRGTT